MNRLTGRASFAAVFIALTLAACGGSGGSTDAAAGPSPGASSPTTAITGVSTPASVSVVTAKNAE